MKFKAIQKVNPQDRTAARKWYAQIVLDSEVTVDMLVKEIEKFSTLTEPDIRGVMIALENVVQEKLAEGRIVRFERLGSLYPSVSSTPSNSEAGVTADSIKGVKVSYRPGKRISDALQNVKKTKV